MQKPPGKPQSRLSHYTTAGDVHMVDVGQKTATARMARARARVRWKASVSRELERNSKGSPLEIARIAGIQAAKRTAELIPLCHSLPLHRVEVTIHRRRDGVEIVTEAAAHAVTGVEMEALTAASVAALTVYDMCKALDHGIVIERIELLEKRGGKSGTWRRLPAAKAKARP